MFFNICNYRMANPNNAKGWDNLSQPIVDPFAYLMMDISGSTCLPYLFCIKTSLN